MECETKVSKQYLT